MKLDKSAGSSVSPTTFKSGSSGTPRWNCLVVDLAIRTRHQTSSQSERALTTGAHAVEAAGHFVTAVAEFAARMEDGIDHLTVEMPILWWIPTGMPRPLSRTG